MMEPKFVPPQEVQFNVALRFSVEELDRLSSEQLAAFFRGIGEVLAMQERAAAPAKQQPAPTV